MRFGGDFLMIYLPAIIRFSITGKGKFGMSEVDDYKNVLLKRLLDKKRQHFIQRLKERYGLVIDENEYHFSIKLKR